MDFCGYFALSNGPNWEDICIIPILGDIFGYLTPRGDHIYGYPPCFAINFEEISSCFVLNVFLGLHALHYQMVQIGKLFE
jgi:hypothetical protein